MLVIRAYSVMDELHVTVVSTHIPVEVPPVRESDALTAACAHIGEGSAPVEVTRLLRQALEQADGYAGDLWDHVRA